MKKTLAVFAVLLSVVFIFGAITNPDTIVKATIGGPDTFDVHQAYDNASGEVLSNVYEPLFVFKGSSLSEFEPRLCTDIPTVANGGIKDGGKTYVFKIRKGVKFHEGGDLSPEDVEYTIERGIIASPTGGPMGMFTQYMFGNPDFKDLVAKYVGVAEYKEMFNDAAFQDLKPQYTEKLVEFYKEVIDPAVEVKGDEVYVHLQIPFGPFLTIIGGEAFWGSIIDKEWSISKGLWDGKAEGWWKYHDVQKEKSPIYNVCNGTGPFKMLEWNTTTKQVTLERFDGYWRAPAKIKTVIIKGIDEWSTRKAMLEKGDADIITVDATYIDQIRNREKEGIKVIDNIPELGVRSISFCWSVDPKSKYIGSGKLDGEGVPPDFFTDENVRQAFSYSFDYVAYIKDTVNGLGITIPTLIPQGMLGFNPNLPTYKLDVAKATQYFKRAFKGQLWLKGFKMQITYNTGNVVRQKALEQLRDNLLKINPKFKVEVVGIQWASLLDARKRSELPLFMMGWGADFPDPHNFVFTYYHSKGDQSSFYGENFINYATTPNAELDGLSLDQIVEKAGLETDTKTRVALYNKIQNFAINHALGMPVYQPIALKGMRTWIKGWYTNPQKGSDDYFYTLSKAE